MIKLQAERTCENLIYQQQNYCTMSDSDTHRIIGGLILAAIAVAGYNSQVDIELFQL